MQALTRRSVSAVLRGYGSTRATPDASSYTWFIIKPSAPGIVERNNKVRSLFSKTADCHTPSLGLRYNSNAASAESVERHEYAAELSRLLKDAADLGFRVQIDKLRYFLTISIRDFGIGMTVQQLVDSLSPIAVRKAAKYLNRRGIFTNNPKLIGFLLDLGVYPARFEIVSIPRYSKTCFSLHLMRGHLDNDWFQITFPKDAEEIVKDLAPSNLILRLGLAIKLAGCINLKDALDFPKSDKEKKQFLLFMDIFAVLDDEAVQEKLEETKPMYSVAKAHPVRETLQTKLDELKHREQHLHSGTPSILQKHGEDLERRIKEKVILEKLVEDSEALLKKMETVMASSP